MGAFTARPDKGRSLRVGNTAAYFKMSDSWYEDPKIRELARRGEWATIAYFYGLIAYSHAHDTDGELTRGEASTVAELMLAPSSSSLLTTLRRAGLVLLPRNGRVTIVRYLQWQIGSDQRKHWAESKRNPRGKSAERGAESADREREVERERRRARGGRAGEHDSTAAAVPTDSDGRIRDWSRPGPAVYLDDVGKRTVGPAMRRIFASEPEE